MSVAIIFRFGWFQSKFIFSFNLPLICFKFFGERLTAHPVHSPFIVFIKIELTSGSFHGRSPLAFNHYISDFDENWCMWLSCSQNPLVRILGFQG